MSRPATRLPQRNARPKWVLPLVLLVISVIVFWILPTQLPDRPIRVEFSSK